MTRLTLSFMLTAEHALGELRAHWRRLLVGAFLGWVIASVYGAFVLAFWDPPHVELVASAIVWSGIFMGAALAYRGRS